MSKIKLFGLALLSFALISVVGCKSNKTDQASENDTLEVPEDTYVEEPQATEGDQAPAVVETDSSENTQEPVMLEDRNGNLTPETVETNNDADVFYIVAGSFTVYSNAQNLNQKLKAKGYESNILEPYGQYNRVTVKSFKTRQEARAALPTLKNKINNQTLWILKR